MLMLLVDRLLLRIFVNNSLLLTNWHCHRMPERSFRVCNRQFAVCARCTGILTGLVLAAAAAAASAVGPTVLALAAAANALDGGTQLAGLRTSTNPLRFALGFALGVGFVLTAIQLVKS